MLLLHALVDYYNIADFHSGREPDYESHLNAIDKVIENTTGLAYKLKPIPAEIRIRLYGGWHDSSTDAKTNDRDILGKISRKFFPTRQNFRIFVEPSDSLYFLPEFQLPHTVRNWYGFVPFRIDFSPRDCFDRTSNCPLYLLEFWRKGSCPNQPHCRVKTSDTVMSLRQKLVDTSIVADTIYIASQTTDWVATFSNDDDIIPGILAAVQLSDRALLVRVGRKKPSPYDSVLIDSGNLVNL